ncbi:MAG: (5-formylfuran-3-yl)methyl phosphate synthase [Pirellulales bacterium]
MRSRLPPGLLVSVRSAAEAVEAVAGGATIVDVKEPGQGSLGRADPGTTADVIRVVGPRAACTLACGELADGPAAIIDHLRAVADRVGAGGGRPAAIKAGPAGLDREAWRQAFAAVAAALPAGIEAVAVAYADWETCGAADPGFLIDAAAACGATAILIDTCDKTGPGLLQRHPAGRVGEWVAKARASGMLVALAGRLTPADVAVARCLAPDVVGVRSAACVGGRLGRVDREHVGRLVATLELVGPAAMTASS